MNESTTTLLSIPKIDGEIRLTLNRFRGRDWLDARYFWHKDDGSIVATKKGVTLALDDLPAVLRVLAPLAATAAEEIPEEE